MCDRLQEAPDADAEVVCCVEVDELQIVAAIDYLPWVWRGDVSMQIFDATATINASSATIWRILTDGANYSAWDPWTERIVGTIAADARLTTYTKLSPNRAFPVTVTEFVPLQRMTWTGGLPFGLFTGIRTFTLNPTAAGHVDFTVRETFNGLLLPVFARALPDMTQPFADFVAGLKARAEAADATATST